MKNALVLAALALLLLCAPARAEERSWEAMHQEAQWLHWQGKYREAAALAEKALAKARTVFGDEHASTAASWQTLGAALYSLGRYDDSENAYGEALRIRIKALGPAHVEVAATLSNLGLVYDMQGRFDDAELVYGKALAIREKALGADHLDVAATLNNLALLYDSQGRYSEAEPLYKRVLAIAEKKLGPEHRHVASTLNNLALLYDYQGRYADAETLYRRALAIKEKTLGASHPDVATTLGNLAALCREQGKYGEAEELYRRALTIQLEALGAGHPDIAATLNNIAYLYKIQGRYREAQPLYEKALALWEKSVGPSSPAAATALNNLAALHKAAGDCEKAEPLYRRALEIMTATAGPESLDVALCLNNLAGLQAVQGKRENAGELYRESLRLTEKALGGSHPDVGTTLKNLAALHASAGEIAPAASLMKRAFAIDDAIIDVIFPLASENEKFTYLGTIQGDYEAYLSLLLAARELPGAARMGMDAVFTRKGIVLDALSREREALVSRGGPRVRALYEKYQYVCARLSSLALGSADRGDAQQERRTIETLEAAKESLDKELAALSAEYAQRRRAARVDVDEVAAALPAGSVLVEYVCIHPCDFAAGALESPWRKPRYFALVLHPSSEGRLRPPAAYDLGEASAVDEAVREFRQEIALVSREVRAGIFSEADAEERLAEKSLHLERLVLAPLAKELDGCAALFVAPDGDLNLVPFGALKSPSGRYLVEERQVSYLCCGRDLPSFREKRAPAAECVIFADPAYTRGGESGAARSAEWKRDVASIVWKSLPGTAVEAREIAKIWPCPSVRVLSGEKATEEEAKAVKSPGFLHFATHGFFLEAQDRTKWMSAGDPSAQAERSPEAMRLDNPLLRSGLVLAGANRGGGKNERAGDDGLLTALEISGMSLQGTDLVVLSACETGLGEARRGEGVFGLRRAFQLAGARTIVMSLWSVPDRETSEIMVELYRGLEAGKGKAAALRDAQLGIIRERRERFEAAHPYFWCAFVLAGEP